MKKAAVYLLFSCIVLSACKGSRSTGGAIVANTPIEEAILHDTSSFYHIDFSNYQAKDANLAIGVFDSGTGGLTVLDALVRFDQHMNATGALGVDGQADFLHEKFIYLADQANMPYGNYYSENNSELLVEHVLKDVQFLLANNYYPDVLAPQHRQDKEKIKAIVIACNTATAYGRETVEAFIKKTGLDIPVIGVIDAGAKGVLQTFAKDESGSVGVFATVGTIASKGYENTIIRMKGDGKYTGDIQVFNQGGYGIAEAVDEENDFVNHLATQPRDNYRGPSLDHPDYAIDRALMDVYNFDFEHNSMLCDSKDTDACEILQINSPENYIRYHLVSLMEKIRKSENPQPLKALVLGCTHYPFLTKHIHLVLNELYNYRLGGRYIYRPVMAKDVNVVDPSENVAIELYTYLTENNLHNPDKHAKSSEFYISVANPDNDHVQLDETGKFTYAYKYGRKAGEVQEYVKVVPFSRLNIPEETVSRLRNTIPETFRLIAGFNNHNPKTGMLKNEDMIGAN